MSAAPFGGARLILDNSAFVNRRHPAVDAAFEEAIRGDQLLLSPPFLAEALYSARNESEYIEIESGLLAALHIVRAGERTWELAFEAMRAMAGLHAAYHRLPPVDYLIAALAHEHGVGVLHYDADYDKLAADSGLDFASVWLAEPGSLAEAVGAGPLRPWRNALSQGLAQVNEVAVYQALVDMLERELEARGLPTPARPTS